MKKYLLILLLAASVPCAAQVPQQVEPDPAVLKARQDEIRALKVVYISQQLNLSPQEKAAFWPLYDEYQNEIFAARAANRGDEIAREEAVLTIKKKYQDQFSSILGRNRTRYFFQCEKDFTQMLLKQLHPNKMGPAARMPMQHKGY